MVFRTGKSAAFLLTLTIRHELIKVFINFTFTTIKLTQEMINIYWNGTSWFMRTGRIQMRVKI